MRSLVAAFALFMTAISAAIGEAFVPLSTDPLLVWNYGSMALLSFVAGVCFWFYYRQLDRDEDKLNMLPTGHVGTKAQAEDLERRLSMAQEKRVPLRHPLTRSCPPPPGRRAVRPPPLETPTSLRSFRKRPGLPA